MFKLEFGPFKVVKEVHFASKNSPPLKRGDRNGGVMMLQAALLEVGYKLPRTTRKTGYPDAIYGKETYNVVKQFQSETKLLSDGVAGKNTIAKLSTSLAQKHKNKPFKPAKPAIQRIPTVPKEKYYKFGTDNPRIKSTPGAGRFNSVKTDASLWAMKHAIELHLPSASIVIGEDAADHIGHYLSAKGTPYTIDLENMLASCQSAQTHFRNEVMQARNFVETLRLGSHDITSTTVQSAFNLKNESTNWFYAIGGYSAWGKGKALISQDTSGETVYNLLFEYYCYDRYNWGFGKKMDIGPIEITDEFMGELHRQGLAHEFDAIGKIKRRFTWKKGETIPDWQYRNPPSPF